MTRLKCLDVLIFDLVSYYDQASRMFRWVSWSKIQDYIFQVTKLSVLTIIFLLTLVSNMLILIAILSLKQKVTSSVITRDSNSHQSPIMIKLKKI